MTKAPQPTERQVQRAVVNGLRRQGYLVFAIPNGGTRNRNEAIQMKLDGVTSGIPDLFAIGAAGKPCWLEVKRPKGGRLSENQKWAISALRERGQPVAVVTSYDEAIAAMRRVERHPLGEAAGISEMTVEEAA